MATHKSALKRHRQSLARRLRNRTHRSRMRTGVKTLREAISSGDAAKARELLPTTLALVDHSVKLGVIRDNTGSRTKSRLARAVNQMTTAD